jgi:hypothetical protein
MGPLAPARRRPQIVNLAVEHRLRELAVGVDGRSFPQQQALEGQLGMTRVAVRAGGSLKQKLKKKEKKRKE